METHRSEIQRASEILVGNGVLNDLKKLKVKTEPASSKAEKHELGLLQKTKTHKGL
jgi:hypothetical protein